MLQLYWKKNAYDVSPPAHVLTSTRVGSTKVINGYTHVKTLLASTARRNNQSTHSVKLLLEEETT